MVGPVSDDERRQFWQRLGTGLVGFVALSAGLVAFYNDATLTEIGIAAGAGLIIGLVVVFILAA